MHRDFMADSGTPAANDVGPVNISVTAADSAGATITDVFAIAVAGGTGNPINGNDGVADFQIELQFSGGVFRPLNGTDFIL